MLVFIEIKGVKYSHFVKFLIGYLYYTILSNKRWAVHKRLSALSYSILRNSTGTFLVSQTPFSDK